MKNKICQGINEGGTADVKTYNGHDCRYYFRDDEIVRTPNLPEEFKIFTTMLIFSIVVLTISIVVSVMFLISINKASAKSVRTSCTVIETPFNSEGWNKYRNGKEIIYYKL